MALLTRTLHCCTLLNLFWLTALYYFKSSRKSCPRHHTPSHLFSHSYHPKHSFPPFILPLLWVFHYPLFPSAISCVPVVIFSGCYISDRGREKERRRPREREREKECTQSHETAKCAGPDLWPHYTGSGLKDHMHERQKTVSVVSPHPYQATFAQAL